MGSLCWTLLPVLIMRLFLLLLNAMAMAENLQKWRPAMARDLSKFQYILPKALNHSYPTITKESQHFQFSKGNRSFTEVCGMENPDGVEDRSVEERIVGGHAAKRHQWPWQVALFIDDYKFCGGTLISDEWVLTAAHCAEGSGYYDVMAGAHDVTVDYEPHRIEIRAHEDHIHPSYNLPVFLHNDIALLRLPEKVPFSQYIRPSCLPPVSESDELYAGVLTTPTGWGLMSDSDNHKAPELQMVSDRPILSLAECQQYYGPLVFKGSICIDTTGGRGIYSGDSGGPLNARMAGEDNRWYQIGVTSFGGGDGCEDGSPHGFTRVAQHLQWIETITGITLV